MIINLKFFGFLIVGTIIYWFISNQKARNIWLSVISLLFLFLYDKYTPLIVLIMSLFSYTIAGFIESSRNKGVWHKFGVISILLILILFKYLGFLNTIVSSFTFFITKLPEFNIDLLTYSLGISYITFKHISFLTDIYWGMNKRGGFFEFLSYSSLFTIFIAGPIERYERYLPQTNQKIKFNFNNIEIGFERIVLGIFKKAIIADWLGYYVNPIWRNPNLHSSYENILCLLGFSIQIYMDFSGYSDIAIGASRFFGIEIMENFEKPYFQTNISQFWRSWHISLSDWIRDYIFFPLSKFSDNKIWGIFFVPVIAMGLCGLWHGPSSNFIIWGIWHGLGISLLQIWNVYKRKYKKFAKITKMPWFNFVSIVITFSFVTIGWWWFR